MEVINHRAHKGYRAIKIETVYVTGGQPVGSSAKEYKIWINQYEIIYKIDIFS